MLHSISNSLSVLKSIAPTLLNTVFSSFCLISLPAFATEVFTAETQTSQGVRLQLTMPVQQPVANIQLGAFICAEENLTVNAARLWGALGDSAQPGHPGPAASVRTIDSKCFQVNEIFFPHSGPWQIELSLIGGDEAVFDLRVLEQPEEPTYFSQSDRKSTGTLTFQGALPSESSTSGTFCVNERSQLKEAILWMPGMGHGSSPTTLTASELGCAVIDGIDFFMTGEWEIRAQLANGENFVFPILVRR